MPVAGKAWMDRVQLQIGCAVAGLVVISVGSLLLFGPLGIVLPIVVVVLAAVLGLARPTKVR
jgi:CHASE2 domain-containing sensor protein